MAVNPVFGPIIEKSASDPNGDPGSTSGNVPATESRTREAGLPTAGAMSGLPPFLDNPSRNPIEDAFGPAPAVGPQQ